VALENDADSNNPSSPAKPKNLALNLNDENGVNTSQIPLKETNT
jgi:hypothetical protein